MDDRIVLYVDTKAVRRNLLKIKGISCAEKIMAVIKADGYGIGGVEIAKELEKNTDYFGVATFDEGVKLRRAGIKTPILILGYVPKARYGELSSYRLETTVYDMESAINLQEAAKLESISVHVAVDTGMNRLGFRWDDYEKIKNVYRLSGLEIKGVFSHYANADGDINFTSVQRKRLEKTVEKLKRDGLNTGIVHAANSAGSVCGENTFDMVRTGIALYGAVADDYGLIARLENALYLYARIVQIKKVSKGESIGYGASFVAERDLKIAVISAGYADGYTSALSNKGVVLLNNRLAKVLGRICMDYFMCDVTDIPDVRQGNYVQLFGGEINARFLSNAAGLFSYEFLCNLGGRVNRIYKTDGLSNV